MWPYLLEEILFRRSGFVIKTDSSREERCIFSWRKKERLWEKNISGKKLLFAWYSSKYHLNNPAYDTSKITPETRKFYCINYRNCPANYFADNLFVRKLLGASYDQGDSHN
jgi:hypothetical protein